MQAGHALPACGQGIAAKSRKVVFFIDFFWRSTCSPVSSGVPTNAVRPAMLGAKIFGAPRTVTKEHVTCIRIRVARG